jgi:hypothetical protein
MEPTAWPQTDQAPVSLGQDHVRVYFVLYAVTPTLLRATGFASSAGALSHPIEYAAEYTVFVAAGLCVFRVAIRIRKSEHRSCLVTLAYCLILPFVFSICATLLGSAILLIDAALEHQFLSIVEDFRESYDSIVRLIATGIETSEPWRTLCYIGLGLLSVVVTRLCVEVSYAAFPWGLGRNAANPPDPYGSLGDLRPLFALVTIAPIASLFASQVSYTTKYLAQVRVDPLVFSLVGAVLIYSYFHFCLRSSKQPDLTKLKVVIFALFLPYVTAWVTSLLDSFITSVYTVGVYFGDGSPARPSLLFEFTSARYLFSITNNVIAALLCLFIVEFLGARAQRSSNYQAKEMIVENDSV